MMGLVKMAPDGWAYYAREIAAGVEDYFVGHGEETGRWIGGPVIAELREALVELVGHLGELADVGTRRYLPSVPMVILMAREGTICARCA